MEILCLDFLVKTDRVLAGARGRIAGLLADLQNSRTLETLPWATALPTRGKHSVPGCFQRSSVGLGHFWILSADSG